MLVVDVLLAAYSFDSAFARLSMIGLGLCAVVIWELDWKKGDYMGIRLGD